MYILIYSGMEYYSAINNKIMPYAAALMDLEMIILSEVRQTEKGKYYMIEIICEKWTYLQYRKRLTDINNKLQLPKGRGGEGPVERFVTDSSAVKNLSANAGNAVSTPRSGRSLVEGNGNPLQYSCLGNPMGRGVWWATVCGFTKSQTWLRDYNIYKITYITTTYTSTIIYKIAGQEGPTV